MLKKILLYTLVLASIAGIAVVYLYFQATSLPEWYITQDRQSFKKALSLSERKTRQLASRMTKEKGIEINEEQMTLVALFAVKKLIPGNTEKIVKGLNVSVVNQNLVIEGVVNLKAFPQNKLPGSIRTLYQQVIQNIPEKLLKESLIEIKGEPSISDGYLVFGDSFSVTVGGVPFPVGTILMKMRKDGNDQIVLMKTPYTQLRLRTHSLALSR
ncbi:MAG: hypothetical protein GY786_00530 [Proteobacteria bacterium]|nr:hypothetical protein [Pseudomonadota bacterium]